MTATALWGDLRLCLASASPRRSQLLTQLGIDHEVLIADVDETPRSGEQPAAYVRRLAREKARAVASRTALPVLGADTAVVQGNRILGKPRNRDEGLAMLAGLSGCCHSVLTGICLELPAGACYEDVSESRVCFTMMSETEREQYWQSGEPADKAGAYGIQGLAAAFIERVEGSYTGVVGLPLFELTRMLKRAGLIEL